MASDAQSVRLKGLLDRLEVDIGWVQHDIRPWQAQLPIHTQNFSKLFCIYAGRGMYQAGTSLHPVAPGDVVFVPQGQPHVDNPVGKRTYSKLFCHFRARAAGLDLGAFLALPPVIRCGPRFAEMKQLFTALYVAHNAIHEGPHPATPSVDGLRANARLRDIIALVIALVPADELRFRWTPPLNRLDRVIARLSADLRRDHPLAELAELAGVHPNHLCRLFTRSVGQPPHQFLLGLRLRRAQELLRTTDLTTEAIAEATGFSDVQHFTRAFSAQFSTPPALYRKTMAHSG